MKVVVAHCDRLSRLGHDLFVFLFNKLAINFVVEDDADHANSQAELGKDLVSIVHVLSCHSYSKQWHCCQSTASGPDRGTNGDGDGGSTSEEAAEDQDADLQGRQVADPVLEDSSVKKGNDD